MHRRQKDENPEEETEEKEMDTESTFHPDLEAKEAASAAAEPSSSREVQQLKKRLAKMAGQIAALKAKMQQNSASAAQKNSNREKSSAVIVLNQADACSVFVANVDYSCTLEDVQHHFQSCGTVNRVTIPTYQNAQPKGYAYVEFQEEGSVQNALQLNGSVLNGKHIKVTAKRTNIPGMKHRLGSGRLSSRNNPYSSGPLRRFHHVLPFDPTFDYYYPSPAHDYYDQEYYFPPYDYHQYSCSVGIPAARSRMPFMPPPYHSSYGYGKAARFTAPSRYKPY